MIKKSNTAFAAFLLLSAPALAQTVPPNLLGINQTFGIVSSTYSNSNTAPQTIINGDVCFTTGPVTPPLTITGTTTTPCDPQNGFDQATATAFLNSPAIPCTFLGAGAVSLNAVVIAGGAPGVIPPGCYFNGGAMNITLGTTVRLRGAGSYIFRPGGALDTGDNSFVVLENGACASDVYWVPIGATTLGANAAPSLVLPTFQGNILDAAGINIGHFANVNGRALAFGGTVLTDANTITVPACAALGSPARQVPTLSEWAMILLGAMLAMAGFVAMRRRSR